MSRARAAERLLAEQALQLSHELRDFRDVNAGDLAPEDFDQITEMGVELASYANVLLKEDGERLVCLAYAMAGASEVLRVLRRYLQGGAS